MKSSKTAALSTFDEPTNVPRRPVSRCLKLRLKPVAYGYLVPSDLIPALAPIRDAIAALEQSSNFPTERVALAEAMKLLDHAGAKLRAVKHCSVFWELPK